MALYYDLLVYRDTYLLVLKIFEVTKDFPKEDKYTLSRVWSAIENSPVTNNNDLRRVCVVRDHE